MSPTSRPWRNGHDGGGAVGAGCLPGARPLPVDPAGLRGPAGDGVGEGRSRRVADDVGATRRPRACVGGGRSRTAARNTGLRAGRPNPGGPGAGDLPRRRQVTRKGAPLLFRSFPRVSERAKPAAKAEPQTLVVCYQRSPVAELGPDGAGGGAERGELAERG